MSQMMTVSINDFKAAGMGPWDCVVDEAPSPTAESIPSSIDLAINLPDSLLETLITSNTMHSLANILTVATLAASGVVAFNGRMTWYNPGLGACGWTHNDGSPVVALAPAQFGNTPNPNQNPNCGRWITIKANGKTTAAQVVDLCPGCPSGAIDVSPAIFDDIAPLSQGVVQVNWEFQ
ncbi:Papain inhibitor [Paramyrothecium foliicola]|nr:Papain inhibitor [Paramyrothecium foliicola]